MNRITINNEELDLYNKDEVNFNLRINTLGDISTRNSSYSNTINIPRTVKNQRILGYVGVAGNSSNTPYMVNSCSYLRDTTVIIADGFLRVLEATADEYVVVIYDGIIDLKEKIGNASLRELDLEDLNHALTVSNYLGSFDNTSGYIYGVADYGLSVEDDITIEYQSPSIYAHTLWNKIFTEAGLFYTGDFFENNTDFYNYVITPTVGYPVEEATPTITNIGTIDATGTSVIEDSTSSFQRTAKTDFRALNDTTNGDVTIDANGDLQVNFTGTIKIRVINNAANFFSGIKLQTVKVNGVVKYSFQVFSQPDEETYQFSVTNGDILSFEMPTFSEKVADNDWRINVSLNVVLDIDKVIGGFEVVMSDIVSDIKQTDFIKDMMQRYGLLLRKSSIANTYEFIEIRELLKDRFNAVDYTSKLLRITSEKYDSGYSQTNDATYKYPSDLSERLYDGELLTNDEGADIRGKLFESPFEIPVFLYDAYTTEQIFRIPIWDNDGTVLDPKDSPAKMMNVSRVNKTINTRYFTPSSTDPYTEDYPFLTLNNVGYQYFLDTYYTEFGWLLESYKEVEVELNLSNIDISKIDFFKLVYLQQTGRYYYIDSIRTGRVTKAKLIEISRFS